MYIFLIFKISWFCLTYNIINAFDGVLCINKFVNDIEDLKKNLPVYEYFSRFCENSIILNRYKLLALTFCK